jgi:GT2 family glycosyltransferase
MDRAASEVLMSTREATVVVTVIVPVYNQPAELAQCLAALEASVGPDAEIIVVDDGSTDDTAAAAARTSVRILRLAENAGPAAARNHGARHARGEILFFVDADVIVAPGAVQHVKRVLSEDPAIAAVFGSYDASPRCQSVVSQYRNLLHHFVHQEGNPEASTFWAGCGAVRRAAFEAVAGYDEARFRRPSIEDIELGYRLRRAGYRIRLDRKLQCTHLKRWRLPSYIWTDITRRAMPWARLILETGHVPNDLNLKSDQRVSAGLAALAGLCVALAPWRPALLVGAGLGLAGVLALNWRLFSFFFRRRGLVFAAACVPLHVLYYLCSAASYALVWVAWRIRGFGARASQPVPGRGGP